MPLEDTKITKEISNSRELNYYLKSGWVLVLSYVKNKSDTQEPRFVVGWQNENTPVYPELLDEWERHEIDVNKYR
jgi:hypothetical protein